MASTSAVPALVAQGVDLALKRVVDAGIALAFNPSGTGIGSQWAAHLKTHVKFDADPAITAFVNTEGVTFGLPFLANLTPGEVVFLVAHETMHFALAHLDQAVQLGIAQYDRREDGSTAITLVPGKEHENALLGYAQDVFINETLIASRIGALIEGGLTRATLADKAKEPYPTTAKFSSEAIYHWLVQKCPAPPPPPNGGQGAKPPPRPRAGQGCSPSGLPGKLGKLQSEQARASIREQALGIGKGSALAEAMAPTKARVDWRQILRTAFETASNDAAERTERSFARPSRRQLPDIIMPGLVGTEARIAVIVDVSGSVGPAWCAKAAGYIGKLQEDFPGTAVWLGSHTHETVWKGWLKPDTDTKALGEALAFTGGTDARETYEDARKAGTFDVLIHFTDCELPSWPTCPARRQVVGVLGRDTAGDAPRSARIVFVAP